jgi:hypothetical protein
MLAPLCKRPAVGFDLQRAPKLGVRGTAFTCEEQIAGCDVK